MIISEILFSLLIPTIISQGLFFNKISVGNIHTTRDYTYVEDLVEAYFQILLNKKFFGKVINVGITALKDCLGP